MPADGRDSDPVRYLSGAERVLVGWSVRRQFETNSPRFARRLQRNGPKAAVYLSSSQTFSMYVWVCVLPGIALGIAGASAASAAFYVLAGICVLVAFGRGFSCWKPEHEYRRATEEAKRAPRAPVDMPRD